MVEFRIPRTRNEYMAAATLKWIRVRCSSSFTELCAGSNGWVSHVSGFLPGAEREVEVTASVMTFEQDTTPHRQCPSISDTDFNSKWCWFWRHLVSYGVAGNAQPCTSVPEPFSPCPTRQAHTPPCPILHQFLLLKFSITNDRIIQGRSMSSKLLRSLFSDHIHTHQALEILLLLESP